MHRAVRRRSSLVGRGTARYQRIDALLELLGPTCFEALSTGDYGTAVLIVLERDGADLHALTRLGCKRVISLLIHAGRGQWRERHDESSRPPINFPGSPNKRPVGEEAMPGKPDPPHPAKPAQLSPRGPLNVGTR